jgi:hypothetical protein
MTESSFLRITQCLKNNVGSDYPNFARFFAHLGTPAGSWIAVSRTELFESLDLRAVLGYIYTL